MRKILSCLVPKSIGRFIYIIVFHIFYFLAKIIAWPDVTMWYRNSLLLNYFSFGFSDIDVSAEFSNNLNIPSKAQALQHFLTLCPLIKEVNIYYPFCFKVLPDLINFFELQRDPKLFQKIRLERDFSEFIEAQKITYLLRMFFSNLDNFKAGLSKRDIQKWAYHFDLIKCPVRKLDLEKIESKKDLLRLIFSTFNDLDKNYYMAIESFADNQIHQVPIHIYYQESNYSNEILGLMPHVFCFVRETLTNAPIFLEQIFIAQLSWEIFGMITQPMLFKNKGDSYQHLYNIALILNHTSLLDNNCENKRIRLIEIINEYQILLENEPIKTHDTTHKPF